MEDLLLGSWFIAREYLMMMGLIFLIGGVAYYLENKNKGGDAIVKKKAKSKRGKKR